MAGVFFVRTHPERLDVSGNDRVSILHDSTGREESLFGSRHHVEFQQ